MMDLIVKFMVGQKYAIVCGYYGVLQFLLLQDPVYYGKAKKCGPVHITIGDGGNIEGLAKEYVCDILINCHQLRSIYLSFDFTKSTDGLVVIVAINEPNIRESYIS